MNGETNRAGYTIIEILIVVGIIGIVAGLSYPMFAESKRQSAKSECVASLHQIGIALTLYRDLYDGSDSGIPSAMGMPQHLGFLEMKPFPECHGRDFAHKKPSYFITWPDPIDPLPNSQIAEENWRKYVSAAGQTSVVVFDPFHQDHLPKNRTWESWTVLGLRLDTSVTVRTRLGFPVGYGWWHR